jgi:hypothetical protein
MDELNLELLNINENEYYELIVVLLKAGSRNLMCASYEAHWHFKALHQGKFLNFPYNVDRENEIVSAWKLGLL